MRPERSFLLYIEVQLRNLEIHSTIPIELLAKRDVHSRERSLLLRAIAADPVDLSPSTLYVVAA